ncbi:S8 family serine peptidase [Vibrio sp. YIC-376]|uniref:S8 family serine peptidase n=1 Tax=Vibrio sp. YIC-376 TaxID=3136162 RepID=UPI00402ADAD5
MFTISCPKAISVLTKKLWCVLSLALISISVQAASPAVRAELENNPSLEYASDSVLIRFKPNTSSAAKLQARQLVNGTTMRQYAIVNALEHVKLGPGRSVEKAIETLQSLPFVDFVEPDYVIRTYMEPDDYYYTIDFQWALNNNGYPLLGLLAGKEDADIDANLAWDITTGSPDVIVAVIDTGVDYNHEDLAGNMWVNTGSTEGVHGYDFFNKDNDPMDENGHGTHVSGTICAQGNNKVGVAGVAWQCQIMALRILGADGSGVVSDAISAIEYAVANGAKISNNSWGDEPYSVALYDAIQSAATSDHLFIAAAGNGGSDGVGDNNDLTPDYPSSFDLDNIISVASTDTLDALSTFSNFGVNSVDIGAPGEWITSTYTIEGDYELLFGTSTAAPHVTGVAVLVASMHPEWGYAEIKNRILSTVRPLTSLEGKTVTGGLLNAFNAVQEQAPTAEPSAPTALIATATSDTEIALQWTDESNNEQGFRIERDSGSGWEDPVSVGANVTAYSDTGLTADSTYYYRVLAYNVVGDSPYTNVASATTEATPSDTVQTTLVSSEIPGAGTVTGTYSDLAAADGNDQTIIERLSGGKPANRYSYLQHTWVFTGVPSGTSTLNVKAGSTISSDGEAFQFSYSVNGSTYSDLPDVSVSGPTSTYSASLPAGTDGTVYIRVTDKDRAAGNTELDEIFVDQLVIVTDVGASPPSEPDPIPVDSFGLTAEPSTAKSGWHDVVLSWNDATMSVDVYRGGNSIATSVSGGTYTDARVGKGSAEYFYEVCEAGGMDNCSSVVVVTFP